MAKSTNRNCYKIQFVVGPIYSLLKLNGCRYVVYIKECWLCMSGRPKRENTARQQRFVGDENNSLPSIMRSNINQSTQQIQTFLSSNTKRLFFSFLSTRVRKVFNIHKFSIFKMIAFESFWLGKIFMKIMKLKRMWIKISNWIKAKN